VGLSNSKLLCNKTKLNQNSVTEMHRNKKSLQKRVKPLSKVGKKLAGVTVHGVERLCSNKLEDVLIFQCTVFRDPAGGGQFGYSTGGGGCRLQVRAGHDARNLPLCHGIRDRPSGLLYLDRPLGSLVTEVPADTCMCS